MLLVQKSHSCEGDKKPCQGQVALEIRQQVYYYDCGENLTSSSGDRPEHTCRSPLLLVPIFSSSLLGVLCSLFVFLWVSRNPNCFFFSRLRNLVAKTTGVYPDSVGHTRRDEA